VLHFFQHLVNVLGIANKFPNHLLERVSPLLLRFRALAALEIELDVAAPKCLAHNPSLLAADAVTPGIDLAQFAIKNVLGEDCLPTRIVQQLHKEGVLLAVAVDGHSSKLRLASKLLGLHIVYRLHHLSLLVTALCSVCIMQEFPPAV